MHAGDLGDHIGMESCVDLETDTQLPFSSGGGGVVNRKPLAISNRRSSMCSRNGKELPPPLPVHTSTVMKRYYTGDGRLIITEEKIESPKYQFTTHRSHGRLTIELVPSDSYCAAEDECSGKVAADSGGGNGGLEKCYRYNGGVRVAATGPCLFVNQNQLHAIRPVEI